MIVEASRPRVFVARRVLQPSAQPGCPSHATLVQVMHPMPQRPHRGEHVASQIWLRESDELVWHRLARRAGPGLWETACGWEMSTFRGKVWPQKIGETGPLPAERCNDCVAGVTTPADEGRDVDNLADRQ